MLLSTHHLAHQSGPAKILPVEVMTLIMRYRNAFHQGPVAPADLTSRCLEYSGLQARIISFCVDTTSDDEDMFWIIPARHALACCARFTCAERLRHPVPAQAHRVRCVSPRLQINALHDDPDFIDYLGGVSHRAGFQSAASLSSPRTRAAPLSTSLPVEVLGCMPGYFFDYHYLHALAMASRAMLMATRNKAHWSGLHVNADQPSLEVARRLRSVVDLSSKAKMISVNLRQLAMLLSPIPATLRLRWDTVPLQPQPRPRNLLFACRSRRPMMGFADFDLFLPANVRGMYVGVREWNGQRRSYCRVDNIFHESITWSVGINDFPARPHMSASVHAPVPNALNRLHLKWDQRAFSIGLNGVGVARARLIDGEHGDAAPPLSCVFFMAFGHGRHQQPFLQFSAVPSAVQPNSRIRCGFCNQQHSLLPSRWSVCPVCSTWVCSSHIGQAQAANCPNCVMRLQDYLGGSSGFHRDDGSTCRHVPLCLEVQDCLGGASAFAGALENSYQRFVPGYIIFKSCASRPTASNCWVSQGVWPKPLPDMVGSVIASNSPSEPFFQMTENPAADDTDGLESCSALANINPHEIDARLRFQTEGHAYFFDEEKVDTSARSLFDVRYALSGF